MRYRLLAVPALGVAAVVTGALVFGNLNRDLVYYLTPTEAVAQHAQFPDGRRFRLGGLVEPGSVVRTSDGVRFTVTSGRAEIRVVHHGAPSQLFGAGIGVVVEGSWHGDRFVSDTMIVKHDENYAPPSSDTRP